MPKQRKKKTLRRKHSKGKGIYIFITIGVLTSIVVWLLVKDPIPETGSQVASVMVEEHSSVKVRTDKQKEKQDSKEAKKKTKETKHARKQVSKVKGKTVISPPKTNPVPKPLTATAPDYDAVIKSICKKLGIPESSIRRRKNGAITTYSVPIDRSNMDLTYANMIFKGEMDRAGAIFQKGADTASKQSISFASKTAPSRYQIDLYYDSGVYSQKQRKRQIAIVVDDFGAINGELLDGFLALDKEVCFAIFPDEPHSITTMEKAKAQGRETIIHVPMEPIGYPNVNPGKNAIFVQYSESDIDRILTRFIKQLPHCQGINNHMGSLATTDETIMRAVMSTLKKHGLFFLDSRTTNVSVAYSIAQKAHLKAFRNDLFLDAPNTSQSTMDSKLSQIVQLSDSRSNIIAITHCHNYDKLKYLKAIIAKLKAAGFTLVPLSEIGQYNVPGIL